MKYEKSTVEIIEFDDKEFFVKSISGLGNCNDVVGPLSQSEVNANTTGCLRFSYSSDKQYYTCNSFTFAGYSAEIICSVVNAPSYCHVVSRASNL